ncbi:MAG: hypothetical protein IKP22_00185 [Clostridia bacterium]|nr:hypothetical protein [Clostridia bacterium]
MKKILSFSLCLALLLGCSAATAETAGRTFTGELSVNGRFTVRWIAPEGYHVTDVDSAEGGYMILTLLPDDDNAGGRPMMTVSIAPDELLSDVKRLNDLDDAVLEMIADTFRAEDRVEVTYMETANGTKLMVIKEVMENVDFVDFYTIYMGYEIELVLTQTADMRGTSITDGQITSVMRFLSDMEFLPAE